MGRLARGGSGIAAGQLPQFRLIPFRPWGINLREPVKQLKQCQQIRVNPADDFQRFLVVLRQVGPMPDWFVVKNPVTQVAYRVQALGNVVFAGVSGPAGKEKLLSIAAATTFARNGCRKD